MEGAVTHSTEESWLLASDLDGTLIPTREDDRAAAAIERIARLTESGRLRLAYVTGRHVELALEGIERFGLPLPEAIAADVGTSLHWREAGGFALDVAYEDSVASSPGVPKSGEVHAALAQVPGLRPQEEAKQARFKVSYYFDGEFSPEVLEMLAKRLSEVGRVRLVHSRDPVTGVGLLDVLPSLVGKETAVASISTRLKAGRNEIVFAGDSGNDTAAILAGHRAIVVGNAAEKLKTQLRAGASERGITDCVFFAEAPFAAGVVEGLEHHRAPGCHLSR